jgi:hypothetical protein
MRAIRDIFDSTRDVTSGIATYVALTELASDAQSDTFTSRINQIADRAGVSYRTAFKVLKRFETLGFIVIRRNMVAGEHGPSTYTLCNHSPTLGNGCTTLGNNQKGRGLPKGLKNAEKNPKKNTNAGTVRPLTPELAQIVAEAEDGIISSQQFFDRLKIHFPRINISTEHPEYIAWCRKRGRRPTYAGFIRSWILRAERELPAPSRQSSSCVRLSERYQRELEASREKADRENAPV